MLTKIGCGDWMYSLVHPGDRKSGAVTVRFFVLGYTRPSVAR